METEEVMSTYLGNLDEMKRLGQRLKVHLQWVNCDATDIAEDLGVTVEQVNLAFDGDTTTPLALAVAIAKYCGCELMPTEV